MQQDLKNGEPNKPKSSEGNKVEGSREEGVTGRADGGRGNDTEEDEVLVDGANLSVSLSFMAFSFLSLSSPFLSTLVMKD